MKKTISFTLVCLSLTVTGLAENPPPLPPSPPLPPDISGDPGAPLSSENTGAPPTVGLVFNSPCAGHPTNATVKWILNPGGSTGAGTLSLGPDGTLYAATGFNNMGVLLAIDLAQVNPTSPDYPAAAAFKRWQTDGESSGALFGTPVVGASGNIYHSTGNRVSAWNSSNGSNLWAFSNSGSATWYGIGYHPTLSPDETTLYVTTDSLIFALTNAPGVTNTYYSTNKILAAPPQVFAYALTNVGLKWVRSYPDYQVVNGLLPENYYYGFQYSQPAVGIDGTIFINTDYGSLLAINPANGNLKWLALTDYVTSTPAIGADGTLYFGTVNNFVALNPNGPVTNLCLSTNSIKWIYRDSTTNNSGQIAAWYYWSPVIGPDGTIYAEAMGHDQPASPSRLLAFNPATGVPKWINTLGLVPNGSEQREYLDKSGSLALAANGELFCADLDGIFWSFCSATGATNYTYSNSVPFLYVVSDEPGVLTITNTGQLWPNVAPDSFTFVDLATFDLTYDNAAGVLVANGSITGGTINYSNGTFTVYGVPPGGAYEVSYRYNGVKQLAGFNTPVIAADGTVYTEQIDSVYGVRLYAFQGSSPVACSAWPQESRNARRTAAVTTARVGSPSAMAGGVFKFGITGASNAPVCVCATTNLGEPWANLGQFILSPNGTATFTTPLNAGPPRQFYIAKPQ